MYLKETQTQKNERRAVRAAGRKEQKKISDFTYREVKA